MISFAITVCNELEEVVRLLDQVQNAAGIDDEIVIQWDEGKGSKEVWNMLYAYEQTLKETKNELPIRLIKFPLNRDFSSFKNNLKGECTEEWIFQIDADEELGAGLQSNLHDIVKSNSKFDAMALPRINTVDGLTLKDVQDWGWHLSPSLNPDDNHIVKEFEEGDEFLELLEKHQLVTSTVLEVSPSSHKVITYTAPAVNWPDYQCRIIKNIPEIKWINKVHEIISGHDMIGFAPQEPEWSLLHSKTINKQRSQNSLYNSL